MTLTMITMSVMAEMIAFDHCAENRDIGTLTCHLHCNEVPNTTLSHARWLLAMMISRVREDGGRRLGPSSKVDGEQCRGAAYVNT